MSTNKTQAEQLPQDAVMPRRLTAENGAKALLTGEFFEYHEISYYDEGGDGGGGSLD